MNTVRDSERLVAMWLEEGPRILPESTRRAIDVTTNNTRQARRAQLAPWRNFTMTKFAALAGAGLVVLAAGTFAVLTRPPSDDQTDVPPSRSHGPTATPAPSASGPAVSPNAKLPGLIAFSKVTNAAATISVAAPDGTGMRPLISAPVQDVQPAWSPDGRRIAWATRNGIWIAQADGSGVVTLTDDGRDRDPAWSPDGTRIVFASSRDGDLEIYVEPVSGGEVTQLTDNDVEDSHPSWSATWNKIAFTSDRAGSRDIWTMGPEGENPSRLTVERGEDDAPAWSPDGSTIAFTSDREGEIPLAYVMNADGSGIERLTTGDVEALGPTWSPDGRYIAFSGHPTPGGAAIVIVDVAARRMVGSFAQLRGELNDPTWRP